MSYEGTHWSCGHERKDHCRCDERKVKAMTLDEDAAKVVDDVLAQFPGAWVGGRQKIIFSIAMTAFGRRCAEAMRAECINGIEDRVAVLRGRMHTSHEDLVAGGLMEARNIVKRVEVK